jgi:hypothetical protein
MTHPSCFAEITVEGCTSLGIENPNNVFLGQGTYWTVGPKGGVNTALNAHQVSSRPGTFTARMSCNLFVTFLRLMLLIEEHVFE